MMNRLTGLDGVSLHGETAVMPTHVLAVMFLDQAARGELTARALLRLLAARACAIPSFRQRLLTKPFGLGQPAWIEDPAFDIRDHLHQVRLAEPGTMRELNSLIGELHAQPLDRHRPLWDSWVVQGLADGRLVVVIKFSHALSDGVRAVTSLLPELMTSDPDAAFAATAQRPPAPVPGMAARAWDVVDEAAANTAAGLRVTARLAPVAVKSVLGATLGSLRQLLADAAPRHAEQAENARRTPLNAALTARRSVAFAEVAMEDVRAIAAAFGVTVNDVFLTATTSSLRRWLQTHDTVPSFPLRTMMPISTRAAADQACNSWSPVVVTLPVQLAEPAEQLAAIHHGTSRIKNRRGSTPPVNLADVIDLVPPVLIGLASGLYSGLKLSRFHSPVAHMITSNVPGPPRAMYCAGAHVLGIHALAPLVEGANLNVTAVSYDGTFAVGIVACPDNVDDVAAVARGLEDAVKALRTAADEKTGRSAVAGPSSLERAMSLTTPTEFTHPNKRRGTQAETAGTKQPA